MCRGVGAGCSGLGSCGGCEVARGGVTYRPQSQHTPARPSPHQAASTPPSPGRSGVDSDTVLCLPSTLIVDKNEISITCQ